MHFDQRQHPIPTAALAPPSSCTSGRPEVSGSIPSATAPTRTLRPLVDAPYSPTTSRTRSPAAHFTGARPLGDPPAPSHSDSSPLTVRLAPASSLQSPCILAFAPPSSCAGGRRSVPGSTPLANRINPPAPTAGRCCLLAFTILALAALAPAAPAADPLEYSPPRAATALHSRSEQRQHPRSNVPASWRSLRPLVARPATFTRSLAQHPWQPTNRLQPLHTRSRDARCAGARPTRIPRTTLPRLRSLAQSLLFAHAPTSASILRS